MYNEHDGDGRHRYTVAQIAGLLGVSRTTIYRALEPGEVRTGPAGTAGARAGAGE